jgi:CheY-like chemotaxis protein
VSEPEASAPRILIVEDERELGQVFVDYAVELGYRPELVGTAEAGVERLAAARPDVILLDVMLPVMSGLEFLALPAVRDSGVPVIAISGYVSEDQARECLRLGAMEFLAKPVPLQVLGTVLEHVAMMAVAKGPTPRERRLASRLPVTLPLRARTDEGVVATGAVIEVSATGLRARVDRALPVGTAARLAVPLTDGGPALDMLALVVRSDGEHMVAFWFLDVTPADVDRLMARAHPAR